MPVPVSPLVELSLRHFAYFLVLLLAILGCTYDPGNEITVKEINKTNPVSTLSVNGLNPGDTIYLFETTDINFKVGVDVGTVKSVRVRIDGGDGVVLNTGSEGTVRIHVGYGGLYTGTYTVNVEIESTAATNSIADKMDKETVITVQSFPLKVDTEPPPIPQITFSHTNGYLKASWEPYRRKNFKSYYVSYGVEGGYSPRVRQVEITDPEKTFLIDSNYVTGYPLKFEVTTRTVLGGATGRATYYHQPPELKMNYSFSDSMVHISWNKPKLVGAFKSYVIGNGGASPIAEIFNVSDTTFTYKADAALGVGANAFVRYNSVREFYQPFSVSAFVSETVESQTLNFSGLLVYNTTLGKLFAFDRNNRKINSYNLDFTIAGQTQISGNADPYIASNGIYGYHIDGVAVVRFDLVSGAETRHDELAEIPNTYITSASADGIISMTGSIRFNTNPPTPFTQLKEFGKDEFIYFQAPFYNENVSYGLVSDNGKYVRFPARGEYKRLENGTLSTIANNVHNVLGFRPDDNEELITLTMDGIVILNSSDLSVKRTIMIPRAGYSFSFYDPVTNTVLYQNEYSYVRYIVSIVTGKVTEFKSTVVRNYINGTVFVDNGKSRKML